MKEIFVIGHSLPDAYHKALLALEEQGNIVDCPDYNTTQKEVSMTFFVEDALAEPRISRLSYAGFHELEQYVQEVLDGIIDCTIGHIEDYTYHDRIVKQIPFVIADLKRNPDSRRAVIDVRDWRKDSKSTNPACLQNMQFFIREGKLHMKVLMRSNDAVQATFMNAFAFTKLQEKIAADLGVPVGLYTHRANSFHCYERTFGTLTGYVRSIKSGDETTFNYIGEYDEMMEEERPSIARFVAELREKYPKKKTQDKKPSNNDPLGS